MNRRRVVLGLAALAWLAATPLRAAPPKLPASVVWVGSWASAQQPIEPRGAAPDVDLTGVTLRQVVRLSVGGDRVRLRLSNAFGTTPLRLSAVHVARAAAPGSPRIDPATDRVVTFAGAGEATIPAGADYLSDPIDLAAAPLSDLAVSLRYDAPPVDQTLHAASHATSWTLAGDHVAAPDLPGAKTFTHWLQISGVDVARTSGASVVALGDSITDGSWSTTDGNDRWPDVLAARLQADPRTAHLGVLNVGIGGNRVLLDGRGASALARFDRDVLAQAGARYLVVLEGVNDLGTLTRDGPVSPEEHAELVARITAAYAQIIARGHQRGLRVYGATILPFGGAKTYHPDARNEADRQAVNAWIRAPGHFDGVIDFDAATRDPAAPDQLPPAYDSGDHLHPSPAGYRAMGQALDLTLFGAK
ncbi:SGNH/GDSL hydrolase family protein [Caulobacter sp.]|uniref:SGNH/GDSL hydrolase family protein n=1 Tax=Caulobacter sp. TaxID=78 RepID=UPI003BB1A111